MKIGPEPPPPAPARPAPQSVEPARPFADFLADPEVRAARFTELGMFGRNRAQSGPEPAPAVAAGPDDSPPQTPARPTFAALGKAPDVVSANPAQRPPLPSNEPAPCDLPRAVPAKARPDETCSLPGETPGRTRGAGRRAGPDDGARPAMPKPRLRHDAARTGVSLAMREAGGAVEIVAGAPPIDPEARAQLRRLVEAILARSGLSLAQFQLNGAPLAPDNLGMTGGINGTRTH